MNQEKSTTATLSERIDAAFRLVAREVIETAERTGTDIVIWRDNQIARLTPAQARIEIAAQYPSENWQLITNN